MARLGSDIEIVFSAADEFSGTLNKFRSEMGSAASEAEKTWSNIRDGWLKVAGAIAGAAYIAKKAWDVAEIAARFEEQKIALDGLAKQYGSSAAVMISSIQRAAEGTIAMTDAIGVANKALMMGLNPEQLEFFTMAAKRLSGAIGGDTASAFERLTEAVATGQQRTLRQIGIIVDLENEYKKYGHELSTAEKQAINFEAVSRSLNMTLARMGPDIDTAADKMERLGVKMKDAKKSMGDIVLSAAGAVYGIFYPVGLESALAQAESDSKNLYKNLDELNRKAKELAAEGLFISPTEQDVYRTREWLTINLTYMEHLEREAERFKEQMLKTPINIYWLPSDEEISRKIKEMEDAHQRFYNMSPGPEVMTVPGAPAQLQEAVQMNERLNAIQAYHSQRIQFAIAAGKSQEEINALANEAQITNDRQTAEMRLSIAQGTMGMMSNMMQNMHTLTDSKNKEMFTAMKAFAVAETIIQTYRAAQGAYAALASIPYVGPALGVAAAAAAIVAGMARVKQIQSMQPGGATGSIGAGGEANPSYYGGSPSEYYNPALTGGAEGKTTTQNITVTVYALDPSSVNWDKITEEHIVPALEAASDRSIILDIKTTQY